MKGHFFDSSIHLLLRKIGANILFLLAQFLVIPSIAYSQKEVKLDYTPNELADKMINNPVLKNKTGEEFCWHARYGMDRFVYNYELTKNTQWLDAGIRYYDFLIGKMATGPDGYKGWIGAYMYDDKYWIDSHVGDALLFDGMLEFAVLTLADQNLKARYGEKVKLYTDLAKKHLIEKNDKRGTWKENGPIGAYISYSQYMKPGNLKEWKYGSEVTKSGLSHPFNKQGDMAQVNMRLFRLTGDKYYFEKAEKIFLRMKRQLQLTDNHYEWNYWEPFGLWDIDLEKKTTRHWVGINPSAGYQAREVAQMVDAYHHGIVFDETDIKRLINTHLEVMWNKDREKPRFTNSYIAHQKPKEGEKATGTLWTSLMDFDQRIRDLYKVQFNAESATTPDYLYFTNVTSKTPPSFKRKYATSPVKLPEVNLTDSKDIRMAVVIPSIITKGQKAVILNHSWKPGDLEISLYSKDGKNKLQTIFTGKNTANIIEWDAATATSGKPLKGDYRIRWALNGGYREYPVIIQ